jgi:hypothetical protein
MGRGWSSGAREVSFTILVTLLSSDRDMILSRSLVTLSSLGRGCRAGGLGAAVEVVGHKRHLLDGRLPHLLAHLDEQSAGGEESVAHLIERRLRTATHCVPFLCEPFCTRAMAMFLPSVGEGMPDVTTPGRRRESVRALREARSRQLTNSSAFVRGIDRRAL